MAYPVLTPEGERTDDLWLTSAEASELAGIPPTTLYKWASENRGPTHKRIGRRALWLRSSLIEMLAAA